VSIADPHLYGQNAARARRLFFTRFRHGGGNPLEDQDFGKSYVVLYKICGLCADEPNLCGGTL
jgi:hypothetical protein